MAKLAQLFRWLLILLGIALLFLVAYVVVFMFGWPSWLTVFVAALFVLGFWGGNKALDWWKARREARENEAGVAEAGRAEMRGRINSLNKLWRLCVGKLRRSKLRVKGNPLYVLPWYLMLGDSGSGKTSAVKNSRLALPFIDGTELPGGVSQCDWWYMEHAIVLDIPGRYTVHQGAVDKAEWNRLLSLLASTRRRKALNGIVLTIDADRLFRGNSEELRAYGTTLRMRLNETMQRLGLRVPVYILVTKLDHIAGMNHFFRLFPDQMHAQSMGARISGEPAAQQVSHAIRKAFTQVMDNVNRLKLTLLAEYKQQEIHPLAMVFPDELARLEQSLVTWMSAVFEDNPYQENPVLKGMYFSSARQEGMPLSRIVSNLGFDDELHNQQPTRLSLFLHDFFRQAVVRDKDIFYPTARSSKLQVLNQNLGVASWVGANALAALVLTLSFTHNLSIMRQLDEKVPASFALKEEFAPDLQLIDQMREAINNMRAGLEGWWVPWFGLNHSEQVVERFAGIYNSHFWKALLIPMDKDIERSLRRAADGGLSLEQIASHVDLMAKRIKLIRTALDEHDKLVELSVTERPRFLFMIPPQYDNNRDAMSETLATNYLNYLDWQDNSRLLKEELNRELEKLKTLLAQEGIGLDWLVHWADMQEQFPAVAGKDYWGSDPKLTKGEQLYVSRAYTPKGWQAINDFLTEIEAANPLIGRKDRQRFESRYRQNYLQAWQEYLRLFPTGEQVWQGEDKQIELARKLAGDESPYQRLLRTLPEMLEPAMELTTEKDFVPGWMHLVYRYDQLNEVGYQKLLQMGDGVIGQVVKHASKSLGKLKSKLHGNESQETLALQDLKAYKHLRAYRETLTAMGEAVLAQPSAYSLAKESFTEAGAISGEPKQAVNRNFWGQDRLREILGKGSPGEELFWQLLSKQSEQLWGIMLAQAQIHIQGLWQNDVIAQATGLTGWELIDTLQGNNGKVWEFQKQVATPFLDHNNRVGFSPRKLYSRTLRFDADFIALINRGRMGVQSLTNTHRVRLDGRPTGTNARATVQPHKTKLLMTCGSGNQELVNQNYPISKTFNWVPQDCGDVTLEIYVGDLVLEKKYSGYNAFLKFLGDFRNGERSFERADFPMQKSNLAGFGIKNINVSYSFSGHQNALRMGSFGSGEVPNRIFQ